MNVSLGRWKLATACAVGFAAGALLLPWRAQPAVERDECVVLLHGLSRSSLSMKYLEWRLKKEGYQVVNASYPSRKKGVDYLAGRWLPGLVAGQVPAGRVVHFVTHSMGGIVVRRYLRERRPEKLGRVVMLAPPNQGSEIVDRLERFKWLGRLMGPAAAQLGTGPGSKPKQLGPVDYEVGILAGSRSWNLLFSRWLPGVDDGKVSVASTRVEGMKEHRVVPCSHTWLMWRKKPVDEVLRFLSEGAFTPPDGRQR